MGQDGSRGGLAARWRLGRSPLRVRLLATALCALAAGALVITGACVLVARSYLMGQADQQLRAYAGGLISRPFAASPVYGLAPGTPRAGMHSAGMHSAGLPGGVFGIEIRGSGGQLVMRAGPGTRPGPVIPAVPARVAARTGRLVTVVAGRGASWRVISEPIHYRARRIPFSFSAEGFSVLVTGRARPGLAGTLVVGVDVGPIGHTADRLAVTGLAASGVLVLIAGGAGAVVIRAIVRPPTQAEGTLAAAAAGERISRVIADTCQELRRPLSIIHGLAGPGRHRGRPGAGELDRRMTRVAGEAARMEALLDDLLRAARDRPPRR